MLFGAATAAILGIALTVGFTSASAAGAENGAPAPAAAQLIPGTVPLAKIADEASTSLVEARGAVTAAENLAADVVSSGLDVGPIDATVDTSELRDGIDALKERDVMPPMILAVRSADLVQETDEVVAATASLQSAFSAAQEKKAAEDAARAAAEQAAAAAAALAAANTPDGAKATAQSMAASQYGWGADQFSCLSSLWNKESSWNYQAHNPSGATGIPQALPGSKMASAGSDWQTNAATQIAWGLGYISSVYGTPCSAWGHSQATNWY
ncbi:phospholipase [Microbacterium sp. MYb72]|nr:phospholipase [Microbacterium sp. MYb72]